MAEETISLQANLTGRSVLTLLDLEAEEISALLDDAAYLKTRQRNGELYQPLLGKSLGMIFENASTRTRLSFEAGMTQLGGHALFLSSRDMQIGRGEPIQDTANVMSRYVDAVMIRTNSHAEVEEFSQHSNAPVINALTDNYHPCQALADLLTIKEAKGTLKGLKLCYVGDGNNVSHSLLVAAAKMGMEGVVATPPGYEPDREVVKRAEQVAQENGGSVKVTNDPDDAVVNADVIYTDVWASMGYEAEQSAKEKVFQPYQVNEKLVRQAKDDYIFLHCLPAHRGEEVHTDIIDGPHSEIYEEAENRLHVQKALLVAVIQ
ncbi:ornithine carbamoyltransferase [Salsuginibacillus kocurii]|uniref:ornithine carbamoyltransferase n=1 Tax=Salsuginibacillus kocurii TaxID=427078 RepID=UPI000370DDB4